MARFECAHLLYCFLGCKSIHDGTIHAHARSHILIMSCTCSRQVAIADPMIVQPVDFPIDVLGVEGVTSIEVSFTATSIVVVSRVEVTACHIAGEY